MVRRRSSPEGFDELFRREFDSIARSAFLVTGDRATAAEVAQDAFTQAVIHWRKVRRYDRPGAWVRRLAIREAVKVRRRDGRRNALMMESAADPTSASHRESRTEAISFALEAALATLSPKQRAVIVLHYFDDIPVHEAAAILGCRAATASVHLHRARQRLGEHLGHSAVVTGGPTALGRGR